MQALPLNKTSGKTSTKSDDLWETILTEARSEAEKEPALASFINATILAHSTLENALSFHLANKLGTPTLSALETRDIIDEAIHTYHCVGDAARCDLLAIRDRDSACDDLMSPFLFFKGFHALQAYRVANCLYKRGRRTLALYFQSQIAAIFGVDIHPAATIGKGILLDHATGIVIGETAIVEDDVSIMQSVTLGGTGKNAGDRHPKVRRGVLLSAGAKVLGNIEIGEGAKVGAGSVVLRSVAPHTTVVGVPSHVVGATNSEVPAHNMDHRIDSDS